MEDKDGLYFMYVKYDRIPKKTQVQMVRPERRHKCVKLFQYVSRKAESEKVR